MTEEEEGEEEEEREGKEETEETDWLENHLQLVDPLVFCAFEGKSS